MHIFILQSFIRPKRSGEDDDVEDSSGNLARLDGHWVKYQSDPDWTIFDYSPAQTDGEVPSRWHCRCCLLCHCCCQQQYRPAGRYVHRQVDAYHIEGGMLHHRDGDAELVRLPGAWPHLYFFFIHALYSNFEDCLSLCFIQFLMQIPPTCLF